MVQPSAVLLPSGSPVTVKVHPVVVFSICDAYIRRKEGQERVIGTLLGTFSDGVMDVKNCYVVPHNEGSETVAVDLSHHKTMYDLHQKVSSTDVLLGWFATGATLYSADSLIQEFFTKEAVLGGLSHGVHLLVDTTLEAKKFAVQAYTSRQLVIAEKPLATEFVEVPCEVLFGDIERVGAELMVTGSNAVSKPLSEAESIPQSLQRLLELVDQCTTYVDAVNSGTLPGDAALGRYLADSLAVVPHFAKSDFEKLFNESVQDAMTVTYLANLLRAHIALSEKLGTSALPIM